MKSKRGSYIWCLFNVNHKYCSTIAKELKDKGYSDIRVCVPTVSILRKRQKGKDIYEDIPLLFNYGFIRLPKTIAYSRPCLRKLSQQVTGISSWVRSNETMHTKRLRKRVDGEEFDDFSLVATVHNSEVRRFKRISRENKVYQADEIINLTLGSYIVLRGYPFEGIEATIQSVDLSTKEVTVILYPSGGKMEVKVHFDNVIYSIYHNFDENKLYANNTVDDRENNLTSAMVDDQLTKRQF